MTPATEPSKDQSNSNDNSTEPPKLGAPTTDDFLPPPIGQVDAPIHNTKEDDKPVEGAPGLVTPADTLPEQGSPDIQPDEPIAGPDRPHNF